MITTNSQVFTEVSNEINLSALVHSHFNSFVQACTRECELIALALLCSIIAGTGSLVNHENKSHDNLLYSFDGLNICIKD